MKCCYMEGGKGTGDGDDSWSEKTKEGRHACGHMCVKQTNKQIQSTCEYVDGLEREGEREDAGRDGKTGRTRKHSRTKDE